MYYHTCSSWEAKIAKFYKSVPIGTLLSECTDRYIFLGFSTKATNSSVTMYTLIKVYWSVHFDKSVPASKSVRDNCYISCPTLEITHRACCTSTHTLSHAMPHKQQPTTPMSPKTVNKTWGKVDKAALAMLINDGYVDIEDTSTTYIKWVQAEYFCHRDQCNFRCNYRDFASALALEAKYFFHAGKSRPHNYHNTTTNKTELLISPQPTLFHHRSRSLLIRYIICEFWRPSEPAIATHRLA